MTFWSWSRTASSNASADSTINWAEGQAPSSINDSARAVMAAAAKYRDDIAGAIVTGGTSTAYTVGSYEVFDTLAHLNGQMIAFTPHTTNADTVTLNVDSLGAKPLRSAPSTELVAGTIVQGTPYVAVYNNSDGAFYLQGYFSSPYNVPFLGGLDFWDTVTPNSSFIFPAGQAISRTVYSRAFARWGTTYGAGDGSTTFNVPDKTERVSVMKAASASRLTSNYFGGNSTVMGATGGGESITLGTSNLPAYTPSGSVATTTASSAFVSGVGAYAGTTVVNFSPGPGSNTVGGTIAPLAISSSSTSTFSGSAQGGSSVPVRTVPPAIVCNYILRIL
jgi:microcystin-dependent protein